jgi:hypothetical protein
MHFASALVGLDDLPHQQRWRDRIADHHGELHCLTRRYAAAVPSGADDAAASILVGRGAPAGRCLDRADLHGSRELCFESYCRNGSFARHSDAVALRFRSRCFPGCDCHMCLSRQHREANDAAGRKSECPEGAYRVAPGMGG